MVKNFSGVVILSPSLAVILSEAKNPFHSTLRVNFAKDLLCHESILEQILRRPDGMNRDSSE